MISKINGLLPLLLVGSACLESVVHGLSFMAPIVPQQQQLRTFPKQPVVMVPATRTLFGSNVQKLIASSSTSSAAPQTPARYQAMTTTTTQGRPENFIVQLHVEALRWTLLATKTTLQTAVFGITFLATCELVRKSMTALLSIFPSWLRTMFQPLLILYYVPLFLARSLTRPSRTRPTPVYQTTLSQQQQQQQRWNDERNIFTTLPRDNDDIHNNNGNEEGMANAAVVTMTAPLLISV